MKRIGVAAIVTSVNVGASLGGFSAARYVLLGRRLKDPNRGLFVFPGGGVEVGESLEDALRREVAEETHIIVAHDLSRWQRVDVVELDDRIILFAPAEPVSDAAQPFGGDDLGSVMWFAPGQLGASEVSPVVRPILQRMGFIK